MLRKSRCRSSTKIRKMRPDASLVGRAGGRMMPSCGGRRRRRLDVQHAAAVRQHERHDVLLDAVLVDLEVLLLQVGDELPAAVADDHVGRDQVDAAANHFALLSARARREAASAAAAVAAAVAGGGWAPARAARRQAPATAAAPAARAYAGLNVLAWFDYTRQLLGSRQVSPSARLPPFGLSSPSSGGLRRGRAGGSLARFRLAASDRGACGACGGVRPRFAQRLEHRLVLLEAGRRRRASVTHVSGFRRSACDFSSSRRGGSVIFSEIRASTSAWRARSRSSPSGPEPRQRGRRRLVRRRTVRKSGVRRLAGSGSGPVSATLPGRGLFGAAPAGRRRGLQAGGGGFRAADAADAMRAARAPAAASAPACPALSGSASSRTRRRDCAPRSGGWRLRRARRGRRGRSAACETSRGSANASARGASRYAPRTCSRSRACRG